jgi:hypothetical protein
VIAWQLIPAERRMLYSPIGLQLVDDFTGRAPHGGVRALLDRQDGAGGWEETAIKAVRTPSDVISYPGLGRSAHAAVQPPLRCRVRIDADYYRPDYLLHLDGVEFDVHAYDDDAPPAAVPVLQRVFLMPAPNYPYPDPVRVLRGQVVNAANDPVGNVEVTEGTNERVLTDARGAFALPLRWPPLTGLVQIDALDHRTGQNGQITINLPADLAGGRIIAIT